MANRDMSTLLGIKNLNTIGELGKFFRQQQAMLDKTSFATRTLFESPVAKLLEPINDTPFSRQVQQLENSINALNTLMTKTELPIGQFQAMVNSSSLNATRKLSKSMASLAAFYTPALKTSEKLSGVTLKSICNSPALNITNEFSNLATNRHLIHSPVLNTIRIIEDTLSSDSLSKFAQTINSSFGHAVASYIDSIKLTLQEVDHEEEESNHLLNALTFIEDELSLLENSESNLQLAQLWHTSGIALENIYIAFINTIQKCSPKLQIATMFIFLQIFNICINVLSNHIYSELNVITPINYTKSHKITIKEKKDIKEIILGSLLRSNLRYVKVKTKLNIREAPGKNSKVIAQLSPLWIVYEEYKINRWIYIRYINPDNNRWCSGWAFSKYLKKIHQ